MTMPMLLAATKPWTYWFAPTLLVATVALIVALAVGYYRKVMVPAYRWRLEAEQRRSPNGGAAEVRPLRVRPVGPARQVAA